jgi:hypothetical protein
MAKVKILGKAKFLGYVKFEASNSVTFYEFPIWSFNAPTQSTSINNYSVGFDSGSVLVNWGSGDQAIQNNQLNSVTI